MTDTWRIRITLFAAGVIPFVETGGLHDDATVWPWTAGLLCQAGFVLGYIAQRRRWWSGKSAAS
jgi:hypothetical protein